MIRPAAFSFLMLLLSVPANAAPGVGDHAPDWTLPGSDGAEHTLAQYRGQHVVVAFFPKAFTGGWTLECKSLRDSDREIRQFAVQYFMASTDSPEDNHGFAKKNDASFPVLSDPTGAVSRAYGVLGRGGRAQRWTIYIDAEGVIQKIDRNVNPRTAGATLARTLAELNVPLAMPAKADTESVKDDQWSTQSDQFNSGTLPWALWHDSDSTTF